MNLRKKIDEKNNMVSIIMPAYNVENYISQAIDSVINQTYNNWELLIIDDCSEDQTVNVVNTYHDKRIKFIKSDNNEGESLTRNKGLLIAKGKWIAFLDSDDIWISSKLEKQLEFMISNNYYFSYTEYEKISEDGTKLNIICSGPKIVNKRRMYDFDYLGCSTVMYDKSIVGNVQIEKMRLNGDYAIWLKAIQHCSCYLLKENLVEYRVRRSSLSHRSILKNIKSHYDLYRISENRNAFVCIVFTIRNIFFGVLKKIIYQKRINN